MFQRTYSWKYKDWHILWSDILEAYQQNPVGTPINRPHFLGAVVSKVAGATMDGISSFILIDGQQRNTTLALLLAALRDAARERNPRLAARIHEVYLTNQHANPPHDQKLLPSQLDRSDYLAIVNGVAPGPDMSNMVQAYRFFAEQIAKPHETIGALDLEHLEPVILSGLEIVGITLGDSENEYRIFESLNGKGEPLTQADLLRNYLFMRIPTDMQEKVYQEYWVPIQELLGNDLANFFRNVLISEGGFVREGDVYQVWKKQLEILDAPAIVDRLKSLANTARLYKRLIAPEIEQDPVISNALCRLNKWGAQASYPFLLNLYALFEANLVRSNQFSEILLMIESFLVRRLLVGVPTNSLTGIFFRLWLQLPSGREIVEATREVLSQPGRRWPSDRELHDALERTPLYVIGRYAQRRLILESIEQSFGHLEHVDLVGLTIEHVMPQGLTPEWRAMLGSDVDKIHETLLHTIGNLSLTAYNIPLGNSPFEQKKCLLAKSNLELNREIAREQVWTAVQILSRSARMAERAAKIWPRPATNLEVQSFDQSDKRKLIHHVLTRIPITLRQRKLFDLLFDAGDMGLIGPELSRRAGWTRQELAGVLAGIGRCINRGIPENDGEKPGIGLFLDWERLSGGIWRYWLRRPFREDWGAQLKGIVLAHDENEFQPDDDGLLTLDR